MPRISAFVGRASCLVLAGLMALAAAPVGNAAPPPNIVVVMTDDLDDGSFQILLAMGLLPNIKSTIVDRGVRFSNSFATHPLCAPSRATFLTGQYAHNHGVLNNEPPVGGVARLVDASTTATALPYPYRKGHVGKYLNQYGSESTAAVTSPLNPRYVPPGWDDWRALIDPSTYSMYNYQINANGQVEQHGSAPEDYQTAVLGDIASRFVTDSLAQGRPFFLSVATLAPHLEAWTVELAQQRGLNPDSYRSLWNLFVRPDPRQQSWKPSSWTMLADQLPLYPGVKPSFNEADVRDKPLSMQRPLMLADDIDWLTLQYRTRFLSMLSVDDLVGTLATALGSELSNTVWIFTSDNGFLLGEHRMSQKMAAYEESARVPLYIAGPGVAGPARTVDAIALNNDLAPTITELAGVLPSTSVDGRSLVPFLKGSTPPDWRQRFLIEHWQVDPLAVVDVPTYSALRTGSGDKYQSRLYAEYLDGSVELYDLRTDPYELQSLHDDPARVAEIAALHSTLSALKACGGGNCQALER